MATSKMENPYSPSAGQKPPYLAGREKEISAFEGLLTQKQVSKNLVITGLRGVGKTVLLDELKPIALRSQWLWAGAELSESASVSEITISTRILTDLSVLTSVLLSVDNKKGAGFAADVEGKPMNYSVLIDYFNGVGGLTEDKLRSTLQYIWNVIHTVYPDLKGIVFAYDEAQEMDDQSDEKQFPLSVLLNVFQTLQKQGFPLLLVLSGLPTLFPKLIERRGYAERMFELMTLGSLNEEESAKAITKPLQEKRSEVVFTDDAVKLIVDKSGGYPYFIQFICRKAFDSYIAQLAQGISAPSVPLTAIGDTLDTEFFSPKWERATDRERDLLKVIAAIPDSETEFTIKEVLANQEKCDIKPLSQAQVGQLLTKLSDDGLVFRTPRYGKYALGVPLFQKFIKNQ